MAQIKDSGDEVEECIAVMKDGFLRDSFGLPFVLSTSDILLDALKRNVSEARWLEVKSRVFDMVVEWQKEKEQTSPVSQPQHVEFRWQSDPQEFGLTNQEFNPEEIPWQEREPWKTIKRQLPPAMIDTDEKERKVAWRIGFLLGFGAEKAAAAAIREYGLVGGAGLAALFAWAYQQMRRR